MGALFLHLKPDEYLKKLYKTKKLVEKTSFSLQAEESSLKETIPFFYKVRSFSTWFWVLFFFLNRFFRLASISSKLFPLVSGTM
ncbi:hypothetical protein EQH95_21805 [Bacillus subtilis]|nr:hypothetical protein EQH95_21805 [Bacillus subtilis]